MKTLWKKFNAAATLNEGTVYTVVTIVSFTFLATLTALTMPKVALATAVLILLTYIAWHLRTIHRQLKDVQSVRIVKKEVEGAS